MFLGKPDVRASDLMKDCFWLQLTWIKLESLNHKRVVFFFFSHVLLFVDIHTPYHLSIPTKCMWEKEECAHASLYKVEIYFYYNFQFQFILSIFVHFIYKTFSFFLFINGIHLRKVLLLYTTSTRRFCYCPLVFRKQRKWR